MKDEREVEKKKQLSAHIPAVLQAQYVCVCVCVCLCVFSGLIWAVLQHAVAVFATTSTAGTRMIDSCHDWMKT